jgi:Fic family protein
VVGGSETSHPKHVAGDMRNLLKSYHQNDTIDFKEIVDFHYHFEAIHPFQDGNGRVGRLILFKECLAYNVIPFVIEDEFKFFYYRGLKEYPRVKEFLLDTCLSAQDNFKIMLDYFSK